MNADGKMAGNFIEGRRRMDVSTGQIEHVAGFEYAIDQRRFGSARVDGRFALLPGLIAKGRRPHRLVNQPSFATRELQHENVVYIVMRSEPRVLRRRYIGIDLHRMSELRRKLIGKRLNRRPRSMNALQYERGAPSEFRKDFIVGDLIADLSTGTAAASETGRRQQVAAPAHANEGRSEPTSRDQLIDRVERQQVSEAVSGTLLCRSQQWGNAPMPCGELVNCESCEPK